MIVGREFAADQIAAYLPQSLQVVLALVVLVEARGLADWVPAHFGVHAQKVEHIERVEQVVSVDAAQLGQKLTRIEWRIGRCAKVQTHHSIPGVVRRGDATQTVFSDETKR